MDELRDAFDEALGLSQQQFTHLISLILRMAPSDRRRRRYAGAGGARRGARGGREHAVSESIETSLI